MRRVVTGLLSVLSIIVVTVVIAPPAAGAADPGPQVNIDPALHLRAGTLSNSSNTAKAPVFAKWHQYDPSGIVSEHGTASHWRHDGTGDIIDASFSGIRTTLPFTAVVNEYPVINEGYTITIVASNGNGVSSTTTAYVEVQLLQENAATYSSGWTKGSCSCWSGGSAMKSGKAGQTATLRFEGNQVAVVTDRGPGRGSADLLLDGVKVGTLDAAAANTTNLLVVPAPYRAALYQRHTLQVKVTSGRVDIDGFLQTSNH